MPRLDKVPASADIGPGELPAEGLPAATPGPVRLEEAALTALAATSAEVYYAAVDREPVLAHLDLTPRGLAALQAPARVRLALTSDRLRASIVGDLPPARPEAATVAALSEALYRAPAQLAALRAMAAGLEAERRTISGLDPALAKTLAQAAVAPLAAELDRHLQAWSGWAQLTSLPTSVQARLIAQDPATQKALGAASLPACPPAYQDAAAQAADGVLGDQRIDDLNKLLAQLSASAGAQADDTTWSYATLCDALRVVAAALGETCLWRLRVAMATPDGTIAERERREQLAALAARVFAAHAPSSTREDVDRALSRGDAATQDFTRMRMLAICCAVGEDQSEEFKQVWHAIRTAEAEEVKALSRVDNLAIRLRTLCRAALQQLRVLPRPPADPPVEAGTGGASLAAQALSHALADLTDDAQLFSLTQTDAIEHARSNMEVFLAGENDFHSQLVQQRLWHTVRALDPGRHRQSHERLRSTTPAAGPARLGGSVREDGRVCPSPSRVSIG